MDYRIYTTFSLIGWGLWAYFSKVLSKNLATALLVLFTTAGSVLVIVIYTLFNCRVTFNLSTFYAILVGILSGLATIAFYVSLAKGPASVVVPWTGLYIVIPVILSFVFLKEPITRNHIIGIITAIIAIIFLSQ